MAKQIINIGRTANDRSGDPLRTAFNKVNQNFTELYALTSGGTDLQELAQDYAALMFTHSNHTGISFAYDDQNGEIIATVPSQVNADWNATSGSSFIANKPTIPADVGDLTDTSNLLGTTDRLVNGSAELVLTGGPNPFVTFPAVGTDQLFIQGTELGATSGSIALTSIDGSIFLTTHGNLAPALSWQFDRSGTLTTPLGLPVTFTATLDPSHFVGDLTLTGDAWSFEVQFQVNPNGTVQTIIGNNTPFVSNPGYVDGQQFTYTETDHGIPGYTFTLSLADVLLAGPAGWTTNLTASIPPEYPSTVKSLGAIKLTADTNSWTFGTDGQLTVPGAIFRDGGLYMNSSGSTTAASVFVNGFAGDVILRTADNANNVSHDLIFDVNGNLRLPGNVTYPGGITQSRQDDTVCSAGVDTVVYTSTGEFQHAIKLFVMIEGMAPNGDGVNWDTQACDVIAVKGFANNIVHVTTYGVTYTSAAAFATFDGQWNATTNRIEITCRPVSPTHGVTVSVHAIEMLSNN